MSAVHSSGNRTQVRSWTVTSSAASRAGGTTKLGPWTTSTPPVHHSIGGVSARFQASRNGRAAMGLVATATSGGTSARSPRRPCQVTPKATTSRSGWPARAARTSAVNVPMPVRGPSRAVAS